MYQNAQYHNDQSGNPTSIRIEINGAASFVPLAPGNTDYEAIMTLAAEGQLEIAGASPPPAPNDAPREITNFQARALLMQTPGSAAGRTLFHDVDDALAQLGGLSWQAWEYTTVFPRDSDLIATMAAQFNLTQAQIDQMFIAAAAISV
ncbi:MAG: hypothetical protein ACK5TQ_16345 [Acetobacteraceae bacterium]